MMATVEREKMTFTVNDAAQRFERSTARIRQICIEHEIGQVIENRIRLLSPKDLARIGDIIRESGYQTRS